MSLSSRARVELTSPSTPSLRAVRAPVPLAGAEETHKLRLESSLMLRVRAKLGLQRLRYLRLGRKLTTSLLLILALFALVSNSSYLPHLHRRRTHTRLSLSASAPVPSAERVV